MLKLYYRSYKNCDWAKSPDDVEVISELHPYDVDEHDTDDGTWKWLEVDWPSDDERWNSFTSCHIDQKLNIEGDALFSDPDLLTDAVNISLALHKYLTIEFENESWWLNYLELKHTFHELYAEASPKHHKLVEDVVNEVESAGKDQDEQARTGIAVLRGVKV